MRPLLCLLSYTAKNPVDSVGPFVIIRPKYSKVKLGATRRSVMARLPERPWIEDEDLEEDEGEGEEKDE